MAELEEKLRLSWTAQDTKQQVARPIICKEQFTISWSELLIIFTKKGSYQQFWTQRD